MQRWTQLLTARTSRIGSHKKMQAALGPHWDSFVRYAEDGFRERWVKRFNKVMSCCGPIDDRTHRCPHGISVNPRNPAQLRQLSGLHLDHNYELAQICHVWRGIIARLGRPLRSWDDGVNGELICQLLFGVESHRNLRRTGNPLWDANVQFRCGRAQNRRRSDDHVYCHDTDYPHYAWVLAESDVRA